jgi:adenylate kinase family enzyme
VGVKVVPTERLFDHHQVEAFELLQQRQVLQAVSGVGIHHQADARKLLPQPPHRLDVPAGPDLDLDALVADGQLFFHRGGELFQRQDDRPNIVRTRLEVNLKELEPLLGHYRRDGKLIEVDGELAVEQVEERILAALGREGGR